MAEESMSPLVPSSTNVEPLIMVYGHNACQTRDAQFLALENVYEKLYRPNYFDIGGTYIGDVADYWFTYKTESLGRVFLMHLFFSNRSGGACNLAVSNGNELKIHVKKGLAYLPCHLKQFQFKNITIGSLNYITTYSFRDLDVDFLKDVKLYIPISFTLANRISFNEEVIESIKLNHDYGVLLNEQIATDFVIESKDEVKFHVHKFFLLVHSEVFKAMLREDTAESQNNYVKLSDINAEDLRYMLEFIYTGTVKDKDNANFIALLILADRYYLKGLVKLCEHILSVQLCLDNVIETVTVADMCDSDYLKKEAFKFLRRNYSTFDTTKFKEILDKDLLRGLYAYILPFE